MQFSSKCLVCFNLLRNRNTETHDRVTLSGVVRFPVASEKLLFLRSLWMHPKEVSASEDEVQKNKETIKYNIIRKTKS